MKHRQEKIGIIVTGLLVLLLAAGVGLFYRPSKNAGALAALVTVRGETVAVLPLEEYQEPVTISLESRGIPVHFKLEAGKICFSEVDCPDHICENTGWLSREHETAVCMPNRTSVQIVQAGQLTREQREKLLLPDGISQWEQEGAER